MSNEPEGWVVDRANSAHAELRLHWLQAGQIWARARIRWSGCVDFERAYNMPFPDAQGANVESLHICNPQEMIQQLLGLIAVIQSHSGGSHN